jgi:acetyl esterase/lipase
MRKLLPLFLLFWLVACQKNDVNNNNNSPLPEQTFTNVSYGSDAAQQMDIYLPAGRTTDSTKLMVMVHGGAWITGDKSDFAADIPIIKQRLPNYAIANINYRLATVNTNPFPAQENDMKAALNFLVQKSAEYKYGQKIVLLGASAGGHLAMLQAYKNATPKVSAVVDFFGPADMVALYNQTMDPVSQYGITILIGGTPATNPAMYQQSSPINFITAQSPPTIILHGQKDSIVHVSQANTLKAKLQTAGVVHQLNIYPGVGHDFWPTAVLQDAYNKVETFLKTNVR